MWMILFLLLPLAGLAYVGWHVWTLVPLSAVWRTVIVGVGVLSFCMIFLNFTRVIDRMPLWLARWVYDIGNSTQGMALSELLYHGSPDTGHVRTLPLWQPPLL